MALFAVVVNGQINWEGKANSSLALSEKVQAACKNMGHKMVWADHAQVVVRKVDPEWVAFRNSGRKRKVVLVCVSDAPANWLEILTSLYGWV